jgi:hypothetical protein
VPRRQTSARGSSWWNSTISRTDPSDVKRAMLSRVSSSFVERMRGLTPPPTRPGGGRFGQSDGCRWPATGCPALSHACRCGAPSGAAHPRRARNVRRPTSGTPRRSSAHPCGPRSCLPPCETTVHHVTGRGSLPGRWYAEGGSVSQAPSFVSWLLLTVASLPEEGLSEELIDRAQSGL